MLDPVSRDWTDGILSKTFRNDNGAPGESLVRQFLSYMVKLLSDPHNRLILISVIPDHTFLIEQNVKAFRIYQSWESSFDLRYWIDRDVLPGDLCEPGEKVAKALQNSDQAQLAELARYPAYNLSLIYFNYSNKHSKLIV